MFQAVRIGGRRFCRSFSSANFKCDAALTRVRMEGLAKYRFGKAGGYYKAFVDACRRFDCAGYAAHIYDENDNFYFSHKGVLVRSNDMVMTEMKAVLKTGDWIRENHPDVRKLLLVTDSLQAYNHFVGAVRVREWMDHYERYSEAARHRMELMKGFDIFEFGRLGREDPFMKPVDDDANDYLDEVYGKKYRK